MSCNVNLVDNHRLESLTKVAHLTHITSSLINVSSIPVYSISHNITIYDYRQYREII